MEKRVRDNWADNPPRLQPHSDRDFKPNAYPIIYVPLLESTLYDLIKYLIVFLERYVPFYYPSLLAQHFHRFMHLPYTLPILRRISPPHEAETLKSRSPITHSRAQFRCHRNHIVSIPISVWLKRLVDLVSISDRVKSGLRLPVLD